MFRSGALKIDINCWFHWFLLGTVKHILRRAINKQIEISSEITSTLFKYTLGYRKSSISKASAAPNKLNDILIYIWLFFLCWAGLRISYACMILLSTFTKQFYKRMNKQAYNQTNYYDQGSSVPSSSIASFSCNMFISMFTWSCSIAFSLSISARLLRSSRSWSCRCSRQRASSSSCSFRPLISRSCKISWVDHLFQS